MSESDPGADFDIQSVDEDGETLFIEVKSTTGSDGKFHWSMPEFQRALQERNRYILYRVPPHAIRQHARGETGISLH